jgi:integrase
MQRGYIYRKGQSWILSYVVKERKADGQVDWARRSRKLAPFGGEYRTKASVQHLAQEILTPVNTRTAKPESTSSVAHFIENTYLPYAKLNLRPSTVVGYRMVFRSLKPHLGNVLMRDFDTVEAERLLNDFAGEKRRAQTALRNAKNFLSGAFRYAVRTGVVRYNPIREVLVPRGRPMKETEAYTLEEIAAMVNILPEPAKTAVLVAALTGLRLSEIRGLRYDDISADESELTVNRSVWGTHVGETKTPGSAARIPLLPVLSEVLNRRLRARFLTQYVFEGKTGGPLVLANLTRRVIQPTLKAKKIRWAGWHPFRRGLATTLYALDVPDKVIQQILRHSDVAVTRKHYIKTNTSQAQAAMKKLADAFSRTENRTE